MDGNLVSDFDFILRFLAILTDFQSHIRESFFQNGARSSGECLIPWWLRTSGPCMTNLKVDISLVLKVTFLHSSVAQSSQAHVCVPCDLSCDSMSSPESSSNPSFSNATEKFLWSLQSQLNSTYEFRSLKLTSLCDFQRRLLLHIFSTEKYKIAYNYI